MGNHSRKKTSRGLKERRRNRRNSKRDLAEVNQQFCRLDEKQDVVDTIIFPAIIE